MRKIERVLHNSFWKAIRKKADNTRVTVEGDRVTLELFGNDIARRERHSSALRFTLAGHNTRTTRSRLRNVCELSMLCNRGRVPYYGSTRIDPIAWYLVSDRGSTPRRIEEQQP